MSEIQEAPTTFNGIRKQLGPGLIISANIVGSGELIVTTKLGADVGFIMLWFITGCLLKVFVQLELGRYDIQEEDDLGSTEHCPRSEAGGLVASLDLDVDVCASFSSCQEWWDWPRCLTWRARIFRTTVLAILITGSRAILLYVGVTSSSRTSPRS